MKLPKIPPKRRRRRTLKVHRVAIKLPARPQEILEQVSATTGLNHSALLGRAVRYGRPHDVLEPLHALQEAHLDRLKEVLGLKQAGGSNSTPK